MKLYTGLLPLIILVTSYKVAAQKSTFDKNTECWSVAGDALPPVFVSTGGNPGGYISADDRSRGIEWFWSAPSGYLGNKSSSYKKYMRFDMKTTHPGTVRSRRDVIIEGNGMAMWYNAPDNPGTNWTHYDILLDTVGWYYTSNNAQVSLSNFVSIIGNIAGIKILGEFSTSADRGGLDNFILEPSGTIEATSSSACAGECLNFFDRSSVNPVSWQWSFPGASPGTSSVKNPTGICYNNPGTYTVTLIACDACICDTITMPITIAASSVRVIDTAICDGIPYRLPKGKYVYAAGTYRDTLQTIFGCDSIIVTDLNVKLKSFSTINLSICEGDTADGHSTSGTYIDTFATASGCDSIRTLHLMVKPKSFSTIYQTICEGDTVQGHFTSGTYTNTFVAANGCDSVRTLHLTVKPKSLLTLYRSVCKGDTLLGYTTGGKYTDTFVAANGCDSIRTLHLTVEEKPRPDLGPDTALCKGAAITLSPGTYRSYSWQDSSTREYFIADKPGTYTVIATNSCGTGRDDIMVTNRDCDIYFPTAFTPNRDGRNDYFKILNGHDLGNYRLLVYNRWGQKIFESMVTGQGWDGTFNGQPQPLGTYVWLCTFVKSGKPQTLKGHVTLIRQE